MLWNGLLTVHHVCFLFILPACGDGSNRRHLQPCVLWHHNGYDSTDGECVCVIWVVSCLIPSLLSVPSKLRLSLHTSQLARYALKSLLRCISTPPWMTCQYVAGLPSAFNPPLFIYSPGWIEVLSKLCLIDLCNRTSAHASNTKKGRKPYGFSVAKSW